MDPKIRKIFMILFLVAVAATIIVYFVTGKDMKMTWYFGGSAIVFYLLYRFSK